MPHDKDPIGTQLRAIDQIAMQEAQNAGQAAAAAARAARNSPAAAREDAAIARDREIYARFAEGQNAPGAEPNYNQHLPASAASAVQQVAAQNHNLPTAPAQQNPQRSAPVVPANPIPANQRDKETFFI